MTGIVLQKLRKEYIRGVTAVDDLDLEIHDGEFLTLLGPSGCGKSTTLRMIAGLETPTSGIIRFGETIVNEMAPAERNIAMVFQNYALYPHMTVRQNLEYPLRKRGASKEERAKRSAAVASLLRIEALLDRKPKSLSGGQQQRVALGRALIREPRVFLLDEPLSNLDAKLRTYMRAELIDLHRRVGTTMVYVTHDQLEAMTMSDRIAIFDGGRLQQVGTPDEVYNQPANKIVASFIGSPAMNFIEGRIAFENGQPIFTGGGISVGMTAATGSSGSAQVTIGIRPEDIAVGLPGLDAKVIMVEPTGHESIVTLESGGTRIVSRVPPSLRIRTGDTTSFAIRLERIHLFDAASGHRLKPAGAPTASP